MSFWSWLYRLAWISLAVLGAIGVALVFIPTWQSHQRLQRQQAEAQQQIRIYEERIHQLQADQERFHQDPRFVERLAHDLGMARPDEVIFRFKERDEEESP